MEFFEQFDISYHIFRVEYFKFKEILELRIVCKWFNDIITNQIFKKFYEEFYLAVYNYSESLKMSLKDIYLHNSNLENPLEIISSMRNKILTKEISFLKCIDFQEFLKLINRVNISLSIFELHFDIFTYKKENNEIQLDRTIHIPGSKMIYKRKSKLTPYRYLKKNHSVLCDDYYSKPKCEQCKKELVDYTLGVGFAFICGSIYICINFPSGRSLLKNSSGRSRVSPLRPA